MAAPPRKRRPRGGAGYRLQVKDARVATTPARSRRLRSRGLARDARSQLGEVLVTWIGLGGARQMYASDGEVTLLGIIRPVTNACRRRLSFPIDVPHHSGMLASSQIPACSS